MGKETFETKIITLYLKGKSEAEIAQRLGTTKQHVSKVYNKITDNYKYLQTTLSERGIIQAGVIENDLHANIHSMTDEEYREKSYIYSSFLAVK